MGRQHDKNGAHPANQITPRRRAAQRRTCVPVGSVCASLSGTGAYNGAEPGRSSVTAALRRVVQYMEHNQGRGSRRGGAG